MFILNCFILYLAFSSVTLSVKVNMEGTLSLGKDVMASLSHFFGNSFVNTRRSMTNIVEEDSITDIVRSSLLCRDISFCKDTRLFVEEYLIVLARSIHTILDSIVGNDFKKLVFESQLKHYMEIVRNILEIANKKITDDKVIYFWIHAIKKICAKFQEMAMILVEEDIQINVEKAQTLKKQLKQKIVIATALVEMKYQTKLCVVYDICVKSYEVTKSLSTLLESFKSLSEVKVRLFIRHFYEALFDSSFYSNLDEVTAHELQVILNDMAYSSETPTKELLSTVHKIVEARIELLKNNEEEKLSHDALLVQSILSDMDHFYSVHKAEPFADFFQHFNYWAVGDVQINKHIRLVMKDIGKELWTVSNDLSIKLVNEVQVFLEMTIGPES
ncbi:uncharacterized protein LOC116767204 isoform X1 [Danaus plexippus]|uniref:uncharacterized protein LOC116767204 isoform X1 n=2 Tax=Danaus plexippus TaxID=13037 RepID=UPI002AAF62B8|nr:uncharacterized protein LOC116767204 isoform X1 [Danaus plexippus]